MLSQASGKTVTVNYATASGTAGGNDYVSTSGLLTFLPGQTAKFVSVRLRDDTIYEKNETFSIRLSGWTNSVLAIGTHTVTLIENDPKPAVRFAASTSSADEAVGLARFTLRLSHSSASGASVRYARTGGTATAGSDFGAAAGTAVFRPYSTTTSFTVTIINDALDEYDETIVLALSVPTTATLGTPSTHTFTIRDNDPMPIVGFAQASGRTPENCGSIACTVQLSAPSAKTITVRYATADGSARAGSDYTATSGTLTFAAGQTTAKIAVRIIGDPVSENSETFRINLSSPQNATLGLWQHTMTIDQPLAVHRWSLYR